jgi:hypothetical protein
MSKGYLIIASGEEYIKQAYLCALSIRATQTMHNVSLITTDDISETVHSVFDEVIKTDKLKESRYLTSIRAKAYDLTPYEETIVLDSDMLFTSDVSGWWNLLSTKDLFFTNYVTTYRGDKTDNAFYREVFERFNLPNTYVGVHYFKKSRLAALFYSLVKFISSDEKKYYGEVLDTKKQIPASFDFTCSLVINMLDILPEVTRKNARYPTFTHLKGQNQNWEEGTHRWLDRLPYYVDDDLNVYIGNYKQSGILHYTDNEFVTDDIIKKYEAV